MKIKFSKVMAIGCALCVAFAGLTAFADAATVVTTTTYGWDDGVTTMEVDTTVSNVAADCEVTYYVSKKVVEEGVEKDEIVYINQDTATGGTVSFKFTADEEAVLAATAKYGTDATNTQFPTFAFNEGTNYITSGPANVSEFVTVADLSGTDYVKGDSVKTAVAYKAKVSGTYTEYGIKVGEDKYPAAGCDELGNYIVILENIDVTGKTVTAYAE